MVIVIAGINAGVLGQVVVADKMICALVALEILAAAAICVSLWQGGPEMQS